jgi:hypothetical protein
MAYIEIAMTFEPLLEQRFEAGLGVIKVIERKSSLELKYGAYLGPLSLYNYSGFLRRLILEES